MVGRPRSSKRTRRTESEASSFASTPGVRGRMQVQRTRDTAPEMALRRALHSMGLRYRVDRAPLPGLRRRADIVFGPAKVAVFVDGCFWHGCPEHGTAARVNADYWSAKIERNRVRDADTDARLFADGWTVVRVWEHTPPAEAAVLVAKAVAETRTGPA
ncbi:very short patch repair endonuclease [Ornithinimicrobium sp. W1679]|uniref:very short patch repair endonuclease n=1 Tax=Ornithinimicrobium sp. W1679 TaxID=3418770 RepID=UPI003CECE703